MNGAAMGTRSATVASGNGARAACATDLATPGVVLLPALMLLLTTPGAHGQTEDPKSTLPDPKAVSAEECRLQLAHLTDSKFGQRRVGSPGYEAAAKVVATAFAELGLEPAGDRSGRRKPIWFQRVPMTASGWEPKNSFVSLTRGSSKVRIQAGEGFGADQPCRFTARGRLASLDISSMYRDLKLRGEAHPLLGNKGRQFKIDVKGYIVIVAAGRGNARPGMAPPCVKTLLKAGARAVLLVDDLMAERSRTGDEWATSARRSPNVSSTTPLMYITSDVAKRLSAAAGLDKDGDPKVTILLDLTGKSESMVYSAARGGKSTVSLKYRYLRKKIPNVIARIGGSDPILKDQIVVVAGDLDHTTVSPPGALDDGVTGCAALLAMAEAVKKCPKPPERTLLFVVFGGRHTGHSGSEWFARHPPVPLEKVVGVVHLGPLGRRGHETGSRPLLYLLPMGKASESLLRLAHDINESSGRFEMGSAPVAAITPYLSPWIAESSVPAVGLFGGAIPHVHEAPSNAGAIEMELIQESAEVAYRVVMSLANGRM